MTEAEYYARLADMLTAIAALCNGKAYGVPKYLTRDQASDLAKSFREKAEEGFGNDQEEVSDEEYVASWDAGTAKHVLKAYAEGKLFRKQDVLAEVRLAQAEKMDQIEDIVRVTKDVWVVMREDTVKDTVIEGVFHTEQAAVGHVKSHKLGIYKYNVKTPFGSFDAWLDHVCDGELLESKTISPTCVGRRYEYRHPGDSLSRSDQSPFGNTTYRIERYEIGKTYG